MKRKIILLAVTLLMITGLCGCDNNRVDIVTSIWSMDTVEVNIDEDYRFVDFQKVYTEDGKCIVTVNFDKK